jgi:hypothetical protein
MTHRLRTLSAAAIEALAVYNPVGRGPARHAADIARPVSTG